VRKVSILLMVALVGAAVVLPAASARAGYSGVFECDVVYDVWPTTTTSSNSQSCSGFTVGAMTNPTGTCATISASAPPPNVRFDGCSFEMFPGGYYNETCVGSILPPLGLFGGTMSVDGGSQQATYSALRVGLVVLFVPPMVSGIAVWVPHPPIPTCAAPGPLNASMAGHVSWL
jgi:hypothetical protein